MGLLWTDHAHTLNSSFFQDGGRQLNVVSHVILGVGDVTFGWLKCLWYNNYKMLASNNMSTFDNCSYFDHTLTNMGNVLGLQPACDCQFRAGFQGATNQNGYSLFSLSAYVLSWLIWTALKSGQQETIWNLMNNDTISYYHFSSRLFGDQFLKI